MAIEVEVVFFLHAQAVPFGLGGFEDEGVKQGGFGGELVGFEPGLEEFEPGGFAFMVSMMRVLAHMPWRVELRAEAALPSGVMGPVWPELRFWGSD